MSSDFSSFNELAFASSVWVWGWRSLIKLPTALLLRDLLERWKDTNCLFRSNYVPNSSEILVPNWNNSFCGLSRPWQLHFTSTGSINQLSVFL